MGGSRFDLERFIEDCRTAVTGADAERAVRELVERAARDPSSVLGALGEPAHAGLRTLHRSPEMTVLDFTWAPWMCLEPHNHNMWSIVAIVGGREDNVFWRRTAWSIEAAGARSLGAGDVTVLGRDVIHSVTNPIGKRTRAIHVYGGDFFDPPKPRSTWEHEQLVERPWDAPRALGVFAAAEARARAVTTEPPKAR